jgi:probable HAF family extracellular repeat protein
MKKTLFVSSMLVLMVGILFPISAFPFEYISIDYPGAYSTTASGINDRGQIVGYYTVEVTPPPNPVNRTHGFVYYKGAFTTLDYPGALDTWASAINDNGQIVGRYVDSASKTHGFFYDKGVFSSLDYPGAFITDARGINNRGQIIGYYTVQITPPDPPDPAVNRTHGFVYYKGVFTTLDYPDEDTVNTYTGGINDRGQIVGWYQDNSDPPNSFEYFYDKGVFYPLDFLDDINTIPRGINDRGQIVGYYSIEITPPPPPPTPPFLAHGFVYYKEIFTNLDFPGVKITRAIGINDQGQIVGMYQDSVNRVHGFLAK